MNNDQDDKYFVPSNSLKALREAVKAWRDLGQLIGSAVQLRVVVDSNAVLADLRWLVLKRRDAAARTNLMETVAAGTVELFAPSYLLVEVNEKIIRICREEELDSSAMFAEWAAYQKQIKIIQPDRTLVQRYESGVDPKDAPFLALADAVQASGILSSDAHIPLMGGRVLSIDFMLSMRDYSRAAAVELQIKVMGLSLGYVAVAAAAALAKSLRAVLAGISNSPTWLKVALLCATAFCVLHAPTRQKIAAGLSRALNGVAEATPAVIAQIAEAAAHAQQQHERAQLHLKKALSEIKP
jgi:predicted nucleic acid-binding protein